MEKVDWLLAVTIVLILADGLMALPFWHLESNPLVLTIGPFSMLAIKTVGSLALGGVWYSLGEHRMAVFPIVCFLFGFHAAVLGTNLWVLLQNPI